MLSNYLKIALRNLWKHKLFSVINVVGLASGMMVCLLAITHIKGTFEVDNFHPNRERIYRVLTDVTGRNNDVRPYATSPMPLAETLKKDYEFVEETARVVRAYGAFSFGEKQLDVLSFAVDPGFFSVFGYPLEKGRPATEPGTVVLTRKTAERFFGTASPLGQVLTHKDFGPMTVTGVLADMPSRSHLRFDLLFSLRTPVQSAEAVIFQNWKYYHNGYTYVLLKPKAAPDALEKALPTIGTRALRGLRFDEGEKGYRLRVQPLTAISPARQELAFGTYEKQVGGLLVEMGVGLLTLLLATFNYINLTLARSLSRAREVGIRKVVGALRWQVMGQFMAESVVLSLISLVVAYAFYTLVEPMAFVQQWLNEGVEKDGLLWLLFIGFSLLAGLLAGLIPARVLSGFEAAQVLRSRTGLRVIRGISLRKSLIVAQFAISLVAMITLLVMARQQEYMATGDYGFRKENILTIPVTQRSYTPLTQELSKLAGVEQLAATSELFGSFGESQVLRRERFAKDSAMAFMWSVDYSFVRTLGLTMLAGEGLPAASSDSTGHRILINEEAARVFRLGNAREAVGKTLWLNDSTEVQISGVLKDFRFTTFAWSVKPLVMRYQPAQFRYLNIQITDGRETTTVADIQQVWKKLFPYQSFDGQWYDDYLYQRHSHQDDLEFMGLLAALAFSIATLGLLGIVTYSTQTRTKEVGIRKVMGAGVGQVIFLLSWDFVKLLLMAGAIAIPLGYLTGSLFLMNFAYNVGVGIGVPGLCLGAMLLVGGLTIGFQTYRAAIANPTDSLRNE
ncbi:ABC transporter permease [Tellurirhabdus rosea]|uniref:ABC transporter permease n=1 Tax=Tellurirhabdus rosea TaxID=2674997 RepID=UPI00225173B6|nr:ABC transporter permease [Tellurirhabdus rosea]